MCKKMKAMVLGLSVCTLSLVVLTGAAKLPEYYGNTGNLPFSEAVQVGDMLYLSGQIGVEPGENKLVSGGIEFETKQAMNNIGSILARRGLGFNSVVKCTVMLADMADWAKFNSVYVTYFEKGHLPARSAFGSTGLAYGGRIELECWAFSPAKRNRLKSKQ